MLLLHTSGSPALHQCMQSSISVCLHRGASDCCFRRAECSSQCIRALASKDMLQDLLQMSCFPALQHCTQNIAILSCHTSNRAAAGVVAAPQKRLPSLAVLQIELQPSKPQCCTD